MTPRWHAAILTMIAVVGVIVLLWMQLANAEERSIAYECDKVKKTCTISLEDFVWLNTNFEDAVKMLVKMRAKKCRYGDA